MFTLRCTRKLLKRLSVTPSSVAVTPSTVLGDWYANLLYTRPQQLVLAMNERSLLCVLVPASPGDRLRERLQAAAAGLLSDIGVAEAMVTREVAAMSEMTVAATASRAVLGCMNDAVVHLQAYPRGRLGEVDWRDVELYLSQNIYSLTNYETPQIKALELFGITSGVIRARQGPWLH